MTLKLVAEHLFLLHALTRSLNHNFKAYTHLFDNICLNTIIGRRKQMYFVTNAHLLQNKYFVLISDKVDVF